MRMKWLGWALLLGLIVLLTPGVGPGQPPPGGGGGGKGGKGGRGGPPDPERMFGFFAKGSGGEVIDFNKMTPETRLFIRTKMEQMGMPTPPDNAIITKAQFVETASRAMAEKAAAAPDSPQPGAPGPMGGGGPGGPGRRGMSDDRIEARFKDSDRNGDGKLSYDEASDQLKPVFREVDANQDGYIDLAEYKAYMARQFGGGMGGPPVVGMGGPAGVGDPSTGMTYDRGGNGGNIDRGGPDRRDDKKNEEDRPVAIRYGKLPKDLPDWFVELDVNKDGQVGLYEWRAGGRLTVEFEEMDLNGDGLITADELLRFQRTKAEKDKLAAAIAAEEDGTSSTGSSRSSSSGSGGNRGSGADNKSPGSRGPWGGGNGGGKGDGKGRGKKGG